MAKHLSACCILASALSGLVVALPSCAGGQRPAEQPRPVWIDAPSAADTPGRITSVGAGASREEAETEALAALAERLVARVQSQTRVAREDEQFGSGSVLTARSRVVAERLASVSSDVRLLGARVDQFHAVSGEGRVYALASLDVDAALAAHQMHARSSLRRAHDALAVGERANDPLHGARSFGAAERFAAHAIDEYAVALALRPGDRAAADGFAEAVQVQSRAGDGLRENTRSLRIAVAAPRRAPDAALESVAAAVESVGARVSTPGDAGATVRLLVDASIEPLRSFDRHRALRRWALTIEARSTTGERLARRIRDGTVSGPDSRQADADAASALRTAARAEAEALLRTLLTDES